MKAILFLAALMPLGVLAQPININNNPNQPGYVVPSQQRMQNEMGNDSNLLIVFYVQIMPDDLVMQLHRF
ncbi:outer membrane protein [Klebsiella pneumoniae]|nr:outer membrane protein [Klebsiella pneumoniae]STS21442.1 outer membrane protein [Klebsiella pneumoniae]